jgi:hypothetical protein
LKNFLIGTLALAALAAISSVDAQSIKWHPGNYALLNGGETLDTQLKRIDQLGKESSIKGVMARIYWAEIETSKGVYNFSKIDAYLSKLGKQPTSKRLFLRIMERRFGGSQSGIVPKYLTTDSVYRGGLVKTNSGYAARLWEQPTMDRLITLYKVLGARYDGHPNFEGITTEETTLSISSPFPSGYSVIALATQWQRLATNVRPTMPHTNLFVLTNFLGSAAVLGGLIQSFVATNVGVGGPDVIPNNLTLGQEIWTGVYGADYRGTLAIANSIETAELGGSKGSWTPKELHAFAYGTLKVNYLFWTMNTWEGNASQQWSTGILPFLRTYPPVRTTCPSTYGWCKQ